MATRKIPLVAAILASVVSSAAFAAQVPYANFTGAGGVSNFTALSPAGTGDYGPGYPYGHVNNVTFTWDGTAFTSSTDYTGPGGASNATLSSPTSFLGIGWTMHDVQIFGSGTYSFDTAAGGAAGDFETSMLSMTVGAGQLGVHMLMDWNENYNIDILNVWNISSAFSDCGTTVVDSAASNCLWTGNPNSAGNNASTVFLLASTDNDGDGTLGIPMVAGGPFEYHNFNFNLHGTMTVVPVPAAIWLFGSGLLGLAGMAGRKQKA
jgi:hypothetical protein